MVDDDPEDRSIMEDALLSIGQDAHFEENGINALKYLESCEVLPGLIILDLNMPKLNGTETLERLQEDERLKTIPTIIYSTSVNTVQKEKCLQRGASNYIVKPITYVQAIEIAQYFSRLCLSLSIEER